MGMPSRDSVPGAFPGWSWDCNRWEKGLRAVRRKVCDPTGKGIVIHEEKDLSSMRKRLHDPVGEDSVVHWEKVP